MEKRHRERTNEFLRNAQAVQRRLRDITESCRLDMHEPDNQGIECQVEGNHLDNAMGDDPHTNCKEFTVGITVTDSNGKERTEWFNLATLIAVARAGMIPDPTTD